MGLTLEEATRLGIGHEHPLHPSRRGLPPDRGGIGKPAAVAPPPRPGSRHVLWVPEWHPTRLNELLGVHPMQAARLKAADREEVVRACSVCNVAPAAGKRRLGLVLALRGGQRRGDPDGWTKSIADALVHAGALRDDGDDWVEHAPVRFWRGWPAGTLAVLEDI